MAFSVLDRSPEIELADAGSRLTLGWFIPLFWLSLVAFLLIVLAIGVVKHTQKKLGRTSETTESDVMS